MPARTVEPDEALGGAEPDPGSFRLPSLGQARRVRTREPRLTGLEAHPAIQAEGGDAAALHADPQGRLATGVRPQRVDALAPQPPVRGEQGPAPILEAGEAVVVGAHPQHRLPARVPGQGQAGGELQRQPRGLAREGDLALRPVRQAPAETAHPAVSRGGPGHFEQVVDLEAEEFGLQRPLPAVPVRQTAPGAGPELGAAPSVRGEGEAPGPGMLQATGGRDPSRAVPAGGSLRRGRPEGPPAIRAPDVQEVVHPRMGQALGGVQMGPGALVQSPDAVLVGAEPESAPFILEEGPDEAGMGLGGELHRRPAAPVEHRRAVLGGGPQPPLRIEDDLLHRVVGQAVPFGVGPDGRSGEVPEGPGSSAEQGATGQRCGCEPPEGGQGGHANDYRPAGGEWKGEPGKAGTRGPPYDPLR